MLLLCMNLFSQEKSIFKSSGQIHAKVFWNYSYDMTKGEDRESGFNLKRAYLGYKYNFSEDFSSEITLDASHDGSAYSVFVKKAQLNWKFNHKINISLGVLGLDHFSDQEKYFSYRYIMKSFCDEYKFSPSADLGVKLKYTVNKQLATTIFILNGEGNKRLQDDDGRQKIGASVVYKNEKGFISKLYYDYTPVSLDEENIDITTFSAFVGYRFTDKLKLGLEYNKLFNAEKFMLAAKNKNRYGVSIYSTYVFNDDIEVFGRLDLLASNKLSNSEISWNRDEDGKSILLGCQYAPVKGVKMALNYQSFIYKTSLNNNVKKILMNLEFKF